MVEGARAIGTLLDSGKVPGYLVISPKQFSATGTAFFERLKSLGATLYEAEPEEFAELTDTEHSQGFVAVVERSLLSENSPEALKQARLIVYLDGIADPGNLGTIIRTSVAFGVGLLALSPTSVDYGNPKVIRATAGLLFSLPLMRVDNVDTFFAELSSNDIELFAAAAEAEIELGQLQPGRRACIMLGAESTGLSEQARRQQPTQFRINIAAPVESLNVATAAAIAISRFSERMKLI